MTQYHVSAQAAKTNGAGSAADPFLTIGQAAAIARAGDEVVVHRPTYRESVDPDSAERAPRTASSTARPRANRAR